MSDIITAVLQSKSFVWDIGSQSWVAMTQPILNAGSVTIPGTVTVAGTVTANAGTGPSTPWKVDLASTGANSTALKVDGSAVTQPVSGTFYQATQPVSGTVTANQGGTWTVQPGNTANTTAWKVDGSAVTQPVSGTFWQATQPISAASLPLPTLAATSTKQSDGSHKTQIVDGSGNVIGATTGNTVSLKVDSSGFTQPVSGTFYQATQPVSIATMPSTPVTGTFWQATQPVSGTVTANAGTGPATAWKVDLTNTGANATAIKVDGSAVTQPVSGTFFQATQPVSIASMPSTPVTGTFWQATQPVSGTVTANAGTNLNTSLLALDSTVAKDATLTTIDTDIKATQPRSITNFPTVASTEVIDGQTVAFSTDFTARRLQEAAFISNYITSINTILAQESESSQRMGFELR